MPATLVLRPIRPNPVRDEAVIRYGLTRTSRVTLGIFDAGGRMVRELVDGARPAGFHEAAFRRGGLPSGVYFYRLTTVEGSESRKLVVVE
jgi:hypothetical protein